VIDTLQRRIVAGANRGYLDLGSIHLTSLSVFLNNPASWRQDFPAREPPTAITDGAECDANHKIQMWRNRIPHLSNIQSRAVARLSGRNLRIHYRQTLCRAYLAQSGICCHHRVQGSAPVDIQRYCQLQSIQSAEPEGVTVLLEENARLPRSDDRLSQLPSARLRPHPSKSDFRRGGRINRAQRTHPNPPSKTECISTAVSREIVSRRSGCRKMASTRSDPASG